MPSPSKTKGNSFERQTADFLTELYNEKFIRAPGSGAYIGGKNTHRKQLLHDGQIRNFKGDIVPGENFPKLNVECKSYKDFPFHQLFSGHVKILESWIEQCMTAADDGDFNIILMKFNRKGTYVAVELSNSNLQLVRYINYGSVKYGHWAIMDHDTFWELNSDIVRKLCR
jgi:Holliday junction resolvase